jgi:hypothetical protein
MTERSVLDFRRKLLAWGRKNRRSFPWRETDDSFRVLVAEVLLQRSRGKTVAKVYERLFARWPDAESLSRARESTIADVIRPLGLVRRAAVLRAMAKEVVRRRPVDAVGAARAARGRSLRGGRDGSGRILRKDPRRGWGHRTRVPPILRPRRRRTGVERPSSVGCGGGSHAFAGDQGVELGRARSRSDRVPAAGPALFELSTPPHLCPRSQRVCSIRPPC